MEDVFDDESIRASKTPRFFMIDLSFGPFSKFMRRYEFQFDFSSSTNEKKKNGEETIIPSNEDDFVMNEKFESELIDFITSYQMGKLRPTFASTPSSSSFDNEVPTTKNGVITIQNDQEFDQIVMKDPLSMGEVHKFYHEEELIIRKQEEEEGREDVLLFVVSPSCGHCIALEHVINEVSLILKSKTHAFLFVDWEDI